MSQIFKDLNNGGLPTIDTLTGDTGGAVGSSSGNINLIAGLSTQNAGSSVWFSGSPGTHTLTLNVSDLLANTIVGAGAGNATISGEGNTVYGVQSGQALTSGSQNTLIGLEAGHLLTSGNNNTATGDVSLAKLTTGSANTAYGASSLTDLLTGSFNTALGYNAGALLIGAESSNILIGSGVVGSAGLNNAVIIGAQGSGGAQQNACRIAGISGSSITSGGVVVCDSSGNLGTTNSVHNAVAVTDNSGVATFSTTLPSAVQSNITALGTIATGVWNGTAIGAAYGGTAIDSHASTGVAQVSSGTWSVSTALASGTTATTQSAADNSTKVATTAYADRKFGSVVIQAFTGSGTYTPTTGMLYCQIEVVGGGGGGGGCVVASAVLVSSAGGGASGGYSRGIFSAATIGASKSVTIGAAGAGGAAGNNAGGQGGTTSVGSTLIQATGGNGGGASATAATAVFNVGGFTPGVGSLGSTNVTGNCGGAGMGLYTATAQVVWAGQGAASYFGGAPLASGLNGGVNIAGANAASYGSGGGGGANAGGSQQAGGNGSAGYVLITEYVL